MAGSEHSSSAVNRLLSTSNNKEQTEVEMADTSTDHGNGKVYINSNSIGASDDQEKPELGIAPVERNPTKTIDYQNLIKAIQRGDLFKIKEIAYKNIGLFTETSPSGNTVLHIAARYGNWVAVEQILRHDDENKSFIYMKNEKSETPMHIAAKYGNVLVVCILLNHEDEEKMQEKGLLKMEDKEGNTPLDHALRHGLELIAEILIESDDTILQNSEQSPLSIAIDGRLNYIARYLIEKDPSSLNHKGHEDLTPLHSAVIRQDYDIMVDILESNKGLINKVDTKKWNPLHYAAALGHVKIARYLAKVNASLPYKRDINGQTPLHLAVKNDRPAVLKMLLKDYPDSIEVNDNSNRNILHVAAQNGNVKIVAFILRLPEMEDLVNSGDKDGNTPLHLAATEFHSDVVYTFCKYMNVNIRAINGKKRTALEIVQTSTAKRKEIQKHLTTKALKAAYASRGLYEEDIQQDHRLANPERSISAPEVLTRVAHSERALDTKDMQLEHRSFAGIEDIDGEGGCRGKEMAQTLSVMNTLIATFTFTAAFTIPGGFRSDGSTEGMAILVRRTSFKAFVITDTISMSSSMTAAIIVFWSFWCSKSESFMDSLPWAIGLTWIGLISMTLAFVTGLYVVLSENMALAIAVCIIGCVLPLIFYVFAPIISLLSGQPAQVNPFAFSFKMVKLFLKKPKCSVRLSKAIRLRKNSKWYLFPSLIYEFGLVCYWTKALLIALPRKIKELVIAPFNCSTEGQILPK